MSTTTEKLLAFLSYFSVFFCTGVISIDRMVGRTTACVNTWKKSIDLSHFADCIFHHRFRLFHGAL